MSDRNHHNLTIESSAHISHWLMCCVSIESVTSVWFVLLFVFTLIANCN